jgi:hypothetical protein
MAVAVSYKQDKSFGLHSVMATQRDVTATTYDTSKVPTTSLPTSTAGDPLPYLFGTRKISSPKIAYYGNIQPYYKTTVQDRLVQALGIPSMLAPYNTNSYFNQLIIGAGGSGDSGSPRPIPMVTGSGIGYNNDISKGINPYSVAGAAVPAGASLVIPFADTPVFQHETDVTVSLAGYSMDIMFAVCLGPDVHLTRIYAGNDLLWSGDVGPNRTEISNVLTTTFDFSYQIGTVGQKVVIDPSHDSIDTGITTDDNGRLGTGFIWHGGAFDQGREPYLDEFAEDVTTLSSFPGIAYIVLKNVPSTVSGAAYAFEVRRMPNALSLAEDVQSFNEYDLNVASAMIDILTNDWGALGIDAAVIDLPAFTRAAATFASENLFASDTIVNDTAGVAAIKMLQQMTDSLLYCDPSTGRITITLYRDTILTTTPPVLTATPSNVSQIQSYKKTDWTVLPDMFEIDYINRNDPLLSGGDYVAAVLKASNPAVPPAKTRRINKFTYTDTCICDGAVASASMLLMLAVGSSPKLTMTLIMDRSAANVLPGNTMLLNWPEYGITGLPLWVDKWREFDNQKIALDVSQYQFLGLSKYFSAPEPTNAVATDLTVKTPTDFRIVSAPLLLIRWSGLGATYQSRMLYDFAVCLIEPGNNFQAHAALYDYDRKILLQDNMNYTPTAKLVLPILATDGAAHSVIESIVINAPVALAALAKEQPLGRIRNVTQKPVIIFLDDEILSYEQLTKNVDGTWTLHRVHRALIDTQAHDHSAGSKLWFFDGNDTSKLYGGRIAANPDPVRYAVVGTDLNGRTSDVLASPIVSTVPTNRAQLPLRVVQPRVNGQRTLNGPINLDAGTTFSVDWKLRTRVNDNIALADDDSDPKEQGGDDPLYHWMPVIQAYVVYNADGGIRHNLGNSRDAWFFGGIPNDNLSTATGIFDLALATASALTPAKMGAATLYLVSTRPDYANAVDFGLNSPDVAIPIYVQDPAMFHADFTMDSGIGLVADFSMNYTAIFTLPILTF